MPKKCVQCGGEGRYKCPRCRSPYCSVSCCQIHKKTCGPQPEENEDKVAVKESNSEEIVDKNEVNKEEDENEEEVEEKEDETEEADLIDMRYDNSESLKDTVISSGSNKNVTNDHNNANNGRKFPISREEEKESSVKRSEAACGDVTIITDEQKKKLQDCVELRDMLKSKRLREKVMEIDSATGDDGNDDDARRSSLKKARGIPEFQQFVDLLLRTVEYGDSAR